MYTPTSSTIVGSITPITAMDISLHTFLGVSWMLLLPYTILGAGLMFYAQGRLINGERKLKHTETERTQA
jgi:hypothetical protein